MNQKVLKRRSRLRRLMLWSAAVSVIEALPQMQLMKVLKSADSWRSGRVFVVDAPQVGEVQRHRVVPLVVVPFFFIVPVHTGHRGLFFFMR